MGILNYRKSPTLNKGPTQADAAALDKLMQSGDYAGAWQLASKFGTPTSGGVPGSFSAPYDVSGLVGTADKFNKEYQDAYGQNLAAQRNAQTDATQKTPAQADWQTLANYVQSGDYKNAWKFASTFGNSVQEFSYSNNNSKLGGVHSTPAQGNDMIRELESPGGLNQLAPGKQWSAADTSNFYTAATPYWNEATLGKNIKGGGWNPVADMANSAATDSAQKGGAPNIERWGGYAHHGDFGDHVFSVVDQYAMPVAAGILAGIATGGTGAAPVYAGMAAGAAGSAASSLQNDTPITLKSIGTGAATGALGGALLPVSSGISGSLTNAGVNSTVANAIGRGVVGAGTGALSGAITGRGAGNGAIYGGIGGIASGLAGSANSAMGGNQITGSLLNTGAGIIGSNLASKYASHPSAPVSTSAAGMAAAQPKTATTPAATPVTQPQQAIATQNAPNGQAAATQNIGQYTGYGYQPRQQIQNPNINYQNYGAGPEQQFFTPGT